MHINQKDTYTILGDEQDDVIAFASYVTHIVEKFRSEEHLIIDLLKYNALTLDELLHFLMVNNSQRGAKKSFVIVNKGINYDLVPDEMIVVPTIQEAIDLLEMEAIERDLGF